MTQNQTLYFTHDQTEAGFVHSIEISINGGGGIEWGWYFIVAIPFAVIAFSLSLLQR